MYSFNYIPPKANGKVIAGEERFAIRFMPQMPAGWGNERMEETCIYRKDITIYAVSTPSDLIKQIVVYSAQGSLIFEDKNINASSYAFIPPNYYPEVYIVKLITEKGVKNIKVIK